MKAGMVSLARGVRARLITGSGTLMEVIASLKEGRSSNRAASKMEIHLHKLGQQRCNVFGMLSSIAIKGL